ncbi:GNAT family N-acetyltransferase [Kineosporia sp. J2-2]|uniref:GNAT family N-acetyltransferase n=1 Tax=Kineosporia corallincola TaxID=2835133 RepID=A0ABS5TES7_9ACTN|nr:GNAT family N-acetyltransferase [Kineosporia corallincola]MBT0769597.1 GNAT family N-acetyltransferase [Kineosporia corallincola]
MPSLVPPVVPAGSWGPFPQPEIEGDGLLLRPWRPGDEPFLLGAYSDPAIQHWHAFGMSKQAEAEEFIARQTRRWQQESGADWMVSADGKPLGRVGLRTLDLPYGDGEVAYWVAPDARGNGIAARSASVLIDWARNAGMHRFSLTHSTQNVASCRVATRCGFVLEGVAVRSQRHADGYHDMHLHALLLD